MARARGPRGSHGTGRALPPRICTACAQNEASQMCRAFQYDICVAHQTFCIHRTWSAT